MGKLVKSGIPHSLRGPERTEQRLASCRPDPLDLVQHRMGLRL